MEESMFVFAVVSLAILAIGISMLIICSKVYYWDNDVLSSIGACFTTLGVVWIITISIAISMTIQKTNWVNKTFDKSYNVEEMFWNGDDIKSMLIGQKIRIDN